MFLVETVFANSRIRVKPSPGQEVFVDGGKREPLSTEYWVQFPNALRTDVGLKFLVERLALVVDDKGKRKPFYHASGSISPVNAEVRRRLSGQSSASVFDKDVVVATVKDLVMKKEAIDVSGRSLPPGVHRVTAAQIDRSRFRAIDV